MKRLTVADVMTSDVVTVKEDARYLSILEQLAGRGVSALPVVDAENHVIGVVSEADLLHKVAFTGPDNVKPLWELPSRRSARIRSEADTAAELMSAPAVTVAPDATLAEAAKLMQHKGVKRLPVVDGSGRLVGIVSRADLLDTYLRSDAQIREDISVSLIGRTLWIDPVSVEVDVIDGVVALRGRVDRRSTAALLVRLTAIIPGVVQVKDELTWDYDDNPEAAAGYYRSHPFTAAQ